MLLIASAEIACNKGRSANSSVAHDHAVMASSWGTASRSGGSDDDAIACRSGWFAKSNEA